ncbi:MAG: protein YgfX, partial [Clostridia bacterium]
RFELSPSPRFAALILLLHALAAAAAWAALPGASGALLALALVALGGAAAWSRAFLRASSSVRAIEVAGEQVVLELAGGARLEGKASARRYVTRFAVVLPVGRPVGRAVLVAGDMMDAESFRRLRVWALWGRLSGTPGVAAKQLPT